MRLTFSEARIEMDGGVWLCLKVNEPAPARGFVLNRKNRLYDCEIKEHREKRSLDANCYFWVLLDKLAEATKVPKEDLYREAIRNIGGNTDTVCVKTAAAPKVRSAWSRNGLGWISDEQPSKLPGCTNVILYYGSSTYDTAQMSRLIDNIVQDCKAVGVETMTPAQLAVLLEEWGCKNGA